MAKIKLPGIIGLPPLDDSLSGNNVSMSNLIIDSMPIIEITPAEPSFIADVQGYELVKNSELYKTELSNLGYIMDGESIQVAYMANNPPSETFNNDFGDSIMESAGKILSTPLQQARFMFGIKTVEGAAAKLKGIARKFGGTEISGALEKVATTAKQGEQVITEKGGGQLISIAKNAAMGNSFLFPDVWKSSTYSTSYSISVRLYNPNPNDGATTEASITGPLAALLMFVVPRSNDGDSFYWPWLCHIQSYGLFNVQTAYVKSISVIKGGDDNVIAWNQNLGIVDVKIDFGNVFESMLNYTKSGSPGKGAVPILKDYIGEFRNQKVLNTPTYYRRGGSAGSGNQKTFIPLSTPGAAGVVGKVDSTPNRNMTIKRVASLISTIATNINASNKQ